LDVLDRIYQAAIEFDADPVVRLTGDDPMCDAQIVDRILDVYFHGEYDYVANVNPPTFPDGLDVEVISLRALGQVWREATDPEDREHVTRYIRRNLGRWRTANVENDVDLSYLHWALDEGRHLAFITTAFEKLYPKNPAFGLNDILTLENPAG
jgi:spore coat polysaccharide biosynthesis protein SpsF (cytidylyltransferase family)